MSQEHNSRGQEWLEKLLNLMKIPALVKVATKENGTSWLIIDETQLTPLQINLLIGEKGANIDAMEYWANTLLHISPEARESGSFTIELAGYRRNRQAELQDLAEKVAQKVRTTGQESEIKNLSSAERRQVHTYLETAGDLETESKGQEPDRRLVVRLR